MDPFLQRWLACPRCGGELLDDGPGARCAACDAVYGGVGRVLDLVDTTQRVSSEGPGDTAAMAWRRRRWDVLRGATAPENAAYLSAIWSRVRPDDRVLDLGCGPATLLGWLADFAPELGILGVDLSWPALEEAQRALGDRPNVDLVRASTRRRLPVRDASCDVILRRLAPGLPEEIVRALVPGGHYLRFTFGPNHWREVYDRAPGLPRAREDTLAGEQERLRALGLEVEEVIREGGQEEFSLPAVLLALRANPAAFHAEHLALDEIRKLWRSPAGERLIYVPLTTDYAILIARRPADATIVVPALPIPREDEAPEPPLVEEEAADATAADAGLAAPPLPEADETPAESPTDAAVESADQPSPADAETPAVQPPRRSRARRATTTAKTPESSPELSEQPAETPKPIDEAPDQLAEPANAPAEPSDSAAAPQSPDEAADDAEPTTPAPRRRTRRVARPEVDAEAPVAEPSDDQATAPAEASSASADDPDSPAPPRRTRRRTVRQDDAPTASD